MEIASDLAATRAIMEVVPEPTIDVPKIEDNYDELLKQLRQDWKWAASSDFLYKFNPMLHLDFLDLAVRILYPSNPNYIIL